MASQVPSGAIATAHTGPSWPVRVARGVPSAAQVRTVPSSPAVASQVPSGAIATARTRPSWPVRVARGVPSAAQVRTVPSSPPVASQVPSGAIATAVTAPSWPVRVARGVPSAAQVRTVPSSPAVASQVPSGAIATAYTGPPWPVRVARGVPSAAQVRTVPSSPAVASQVPSGAIATASTGPPWPVRVARGVPSAAQVRTVPSSPAVASQVPSGAIATAFTGPRWPVRVARGVPSAAQVRTVPSIAGGGQPGPVRGDRHRVHRAVVAGEGGAGGAVRGPGPHRPVVAGGGQPGPVRGDRHRVHPAVVAGQDADQRIGGQVRRRPGRPGCPGAQAGPQRGQLAGQLRDTAEPAGEGRDHGSRRLDRAQQVSVLRDHAPQPPCGRRARAGQVGFDGRRTGAPQPDRQEPQITAHLIQLRVQARGLQVVGEVLPQVPAAGCLRQPPPRRPAALPVARQRSGGRTGPGHRPGGADQRGMSGGLPGGAEAAQREIADDVVQDHHPHLIGPRQGQQRQPVQPLAQRLRRCRAQPGGSLPQQRDGGQRDLGVLGEDPQLEEPVPVAGIQRVQAVADGGGHRGLPLPRISDVQRRRAALAQPPGRIRGRHVDARAVVHVTGQAVVDQVQQQRPPAGQVQQVPLQPGGHDRQAPGQQPPGHRVRHRIDLDPAWIRDIVQDRRPPRGHQQPPTARPQRTAAAQRPSTRRPRPAASGHGPTAPWPAPGPPAPGW